MISFQDAGSTKGFRIMHIPTTQTPRAFVVFIHLLLIKNAFLRLGVEGGGVGGWGIICISSWGGRRARMRETKGKYGRKKTRREKGGNCKGRRGGCGEEIRERRKKEEEEEERTLKSWGTKP